MHGDVEKYSLMLQWTTIPSGLCDRANLFLYIYVKPYCAKEGELTIANIPRRWYVFVALIKCLGA